MGAVIDIDLEEKANTGRREFWQDLAALIQKHESSVDLDDRIALVARVIGVMTVTLPDDTNVEEVLDSIMDDIIRGNEAAWRGASGLASMPTQGNA